jgi:hypothetical protein
MVAIKIPAMIGKGFLKRAARRKASNCVLSPISARVTTPVLTNNASKVIYSLMFQSKIFDKENKEETKKQ